MFKVRTSVFNLELLTVSFPKHQIPVGTLSFGVFMKLASGRGGVFYNAGVAGKAITEPKMNDYEKSQEMNQKENCAGFPFNE